MTLLLMKNGVESGDIYSRIVGRLNYIGGKLMTIGYKGKDHLGLTFPNPDLTQICQVLGVTEAEFKTKYKGQTVVWHDLEGNPKIRIDLVLYEEEEE